MRLTGVHSNGLLWTEMSRKSQLRGDVNLVFVKQKVGRKSQ